jgi:hypothetical protein
MKTYKRSTNMDRAAANKRLLLMNFLMSNGGKVLHSAGAEDKSIFDNKSDLIRALKLNANIAFLCGHPTRMTTGWPRAGKKEVHTSH